MGCCRIFQRSDDESECGSRLGVASMFLVVEFNNEDGGGISIVREVWVTPRKKECWWPPYKNSAQFNKALESHEQPDERWTIYGIKRIFYQTDDLKKAREKCKQAESESDVLTEIEDGQDKRKRKPSRKLQFSSDSSDGTDIEILQPNTKYPQPPSTNALFTEDPADLLDYNNSPTLTKTKEKLLDKLDIPHESRETQEQKIVTYTLDDTFPDSITPRQNKNVIKKSVNPLSEISRDSSCATTPKQNRTIGAQTLDIIAKHLSRIENKLNELKITQDEILKKLPGDVTTPITLPSDLKIPCETIEELNNLERWLESEDNKNNLEITLSLVGGNKIPSTVRRILEKLFTNKLAGGCNWTGKNKKTPLKNLRVINTIQGAVRRNRVTEKATDAEIQSAVSSWFRFTKDRDGGREERRRTKQQDE